MLKRDWLLVLVGFVAALAALSWYVGQVNESHPAIWPMYGGDTGRRFRSPVLLPQVEPEVLWSYSLNERDYAPLVVAEDGAIYVAGSRELTALEPDGERRWTWRNQENIISLALGRRGEVYLQDAGGVSAFSPDGRLQWRLPLESSRLGGAMMVGQGGNLYVMALPYLHAISPEGQLRWRLRSEQWTSAPVEMSDGTLLAIADEVLYAVSRQGQVKWQRELEGATWVTLGLEGSIYVRGRTQVWRLDSSGAQVDEWPVVMPVEPVSPLALGKGYVQEGARRRSLSGEALWRAQLPANSSWAHAIVDGQGNTLIQQYGVPTIGRHALSYHMQAPQSLSLLDANGEVQWVYDQIRPLALPVPAGDGRICLVGVHDGSEGPALICLGQK